jgi:SPOR domain
MRFTYRAAGPIIRPILGLGSPGPASGAVMTDAAGSGVERRRQPAGRSGIALRNRSRRFIAAAAVLTLLAGCSRTQQDWSAAQQAGTPRAYRVFVQRHPDSELAGVARQRIAQLSEEAAWQQATRTNTAAAYQSYLAEYPNGSWSQDARIRMQSRSLAAPASQSGGAVALDPATAVTARRDVSRSAVQLGAFSSSANAHAAWKQLCAKFRPQLAGLTAQVLPVMSSGRRLYRLEAAVASQAAARRLCVQLQHHSQGCLPLP